MRPVKYPDRAAALEAVAKERNIDINAFVPGDIKISDDLGKHAQWAFKHILSLPYPCSYEDRPRLAHGILHSLRAAIFVPVIANFLRRHGHAEAEKLTEDLLKLIQIAVIFHDTGRMNDARGMWDEESAVLLYGYLTRVLGMTPDEANLFADAVAFKDQTQKDSSVIRILVDEADRLDGIRAVATFDVGQMILFKLFPNALDEIALLVIETRSLIEQQGDHFVRMNKPRKLYYENEQAYPRILGDILEEKSPAPAAACLCETQPKKYYRILPKFHKLLSVSEAQSHSFGLDSFSGIDNHLWQGKVLARGMLFPSAKRLKKSPADKESWTGVEIRKAARRYGEPTRTEKSNNTEKHGNPNRSTSLLGWGGTPFSSAGFLIFNPDIKAIKSAFTKDSHTGLFKKSAEAARQPTYQQHTHTWNKELLRKMKMGGEHTHIFEAIAHHNEVICHITHFDAIYFTQEPTFADNAGNPHSPYAFHPYTPILEAIYIQNSQPHPLPIYEYSGIHNFYVARDYSEADVIEMWGKICEDFLLEKISEKNASNFLHLDIDSLKIFSTYATLNVDWTCGFIEYQSLDSNYSAELKKKINAEIEKRRLALKANYKESVKKDILDDSKTDKNTRIDDLSMMRNDTLYALMQDEKFPTPEIRTAIGRTLRGLLDNLPELYLAYPNDDPEYEFKRLLNHKTFCQSGGKKLAYFFEEPLVKLYHLSLLAKDADITNKIQAHIALAIKNHLRPDSENNLLIDHTRILQIMAACHLCSDANNHAVFNKVVEKIKISFSKGPLDNLYRGESPIIPPFIFYPEFCYKNPKFFDEILTLMEGVILKEEIVADEKNSPKKDLAAYAKNKSLEVYIKKITYYLQLCADSGNSSRATSTLEKAIGKINIRFKSAELMNTLNELGMMRDPKIIKLLVKKTNDRVLDFSDKRIYGSDNHEKNSVEHFKYLIINSPPKDIETFCLVLRCCQQFYDAISDPTEVMQCIRERMTNLGHAAAIADIKNQDLINASITLLTTDAQPSMHRHYMR